MKVEESILTQLFSIVRRHSASFRENINEWLDQEVAEQEVRELVSFRESLSYEAFEDNSESVRHTAVVAAKALRGIKGILEEIPDDMRRKIVHYHDETGWLFSKTTLQKISAELAIFEQQATGKRGRPSNVILDRTVSRCVQAIFHITGKSFVRNLESVEEDDVKTFLHPHAMICEMMLTQLDPNLDHNAVKAALKRHFQKNIRKRKPTSIRFSR